MSGLTSIGSISPGEVEAEAAARAMRRIKDYLARHPDDPDEIKVTVEHGDSALVLPRPAVVLFARLLAQIAEGHGVAIVPSEAELTSQQAANLLNVSRPYLIGLLDDGAIPHRKVGRNRRIKLSDLLAYKRLDDAKRRQAADELSELSQELGLY